MSDSEDRVNAATARLAELSVVELERKISLMDIEEDERRAKIERDSKLALKTQYEIEGLRRQSEWELANPGYHGIYTFYGAVDHGTVRTAMSDLAKWARRTREVSTPEDVTIVLNSPGGSVIDGLALYDFLRDLSAQGHKITTIALGQASSMGGILLQAGDHRIMGQEAWLLIHEVTAGAIGNVSELKDRAKFAERLMEQSLDILASRSSMTKAKIKARMTRTDWWLRAEEALKLGFCDEVR